MVLQLLKTPNLMNTFEFIHFAAPVPYGGGRREKSQAAATGLHWKTIGAAETKVKQMIKTAGNLSHDYHGEGKCTY